MAKGKADTVVPRRSPRLRRQAAMAQSRPEATLLGLPAELRLYIYGYLLGLTKSKRLPGYVCRRAMNEECEIVNSRPLNEFCGYTSLLLTCRLVYNEAVEVLYASTILNSPKSGKMPVLSLNTSQSQIVGSQLPGMFCRNHLVYREGIAGVFRRTNALRVSVYGYPSSEDAYCCWDPDGVGDELYPHPDGLDNRTQAIDNVNWLVSRLRLYSDLQYLSITLHWDEVCDCLWEPQELVDSEVLLKPFKSLRNIKKVKIPSLGTWIEFNMEHGIAESDGAEEFEDFEEVVAYKKRLRAILGSNAPVMESAIPLSTWLSTKQSVKNMIVRAPEAEVEPWLARACLAFNEQNKKAFSSALRGLQNAWNAEMKKMRGIGGAVSQLRSTAFSDVPSAQRVEDDRQSIQFEEFSWKDKDVEKEDREIYKRWTKLALPQ
ncbi:hypothetical protein B0J12DRAFT_268335 [Macrophomina phaseolina]|uniref:DUF7730 domain-containing protein n=1 Tax=Macrophomina phaseolina TaxID=35725 RepID=A0ABQ8FY68_9PEZI|nr:hypothetical protein B0J12DRAFT_268335 [Macrophomina phaseolina]